MLFARILQKSSHRLSLKRFGHRCQAGARRGERNFADARRELSPLPSPFPHRSLHRVRRMSNVGSSVAGGRIQEA